MNKTRRLLCVALLAFVTSANADDRRPDTQSLTIMTFNAEFLWDGVAPEEGSANFPWKSSKTEAEEHMQNVAAVIIAANPDIVNLVEVENLQALTTFNDNFLTGRGYHPYLINGKDTTTGQDVALLTRVDPESGTITRDDRKGVSGGVAKSVSKNYIAKFSVNSLKVALIGIHLLAFPTDVSRELQREAQADAIRSIAVDLAASGFLPVVLGDFNDYDGSSDARDHIDSTPITSVLQSIRGLDPSTTSDDLKSAMTLIPKTARFTAFHDANHNSLIDAPNEFTAIDHILLPVSLFAKIEHAEVPHDHDPRVVSDHFPIVVRLKLSAGPILGGSGPKVRIASLLPNPPGDDTENEEATITNAGNVLVNLAGWKLRDRAGQVWTLDALGSPQPTASKTIKRSGQPMALNNNGDTVDLLDSAGTVVHTVTYPSVDEDELVTPANN